MLRTTFVATALMGLLMLAAPMAAFASGTPGGMQNKNASTYQCKSGHIVKKPKACKEHGGRL